MTTNAHPSHPVARRALLGAIPAIAAAAVITTVSPASAAPAGRPQCLADLAAAPIARKDRR
ncbi:hypothetical protein [Kribbella sp. NPDC006257]|uniref:hypothetical protein n=1 Tax=Kribbella sp. NPDC006257 TaxID=3156738 RepID=UPI0033A46C74